MHIQHRTAFTVNAVLMTITLVSCVKVHDIRHLQQPRNNYTTNNYMSMLVRHRNALDSSYTPHGGAAVAGSAVINTKTKDENIPENLLSTLSWEAGVQKRGLITSSGWGAAGYGPITPHKPSSELPASVRKYVNLIKLYNRRRQDSDVIQQSKDRKADSGKKQQRILDRLMPANNHRTLHGTDPRFRVQGPFSSQGWGPAGKRIKLFI